MFWGGDQLQDTCRSAQLGLFTCMWLNWLSKTLVQRWTSRFVTLISSIMYFFLFFLFCFTYGFLLFFSLCETKSKASRRCHSPSLLLLCFSLLPHCTLSLDFLDYTMNDHARLVVMLCFFIMFFFLFCIFSFGVFVSYCVSCVDRRLFVSLFLWWYTFGQQAKPAFSWLATTYYFQCFISSSMLVFHFFLEVV